MVETITPVVHGGSRTRYRVAVALHAAAATVAAAVLGALLGFIGAVANAPWGTWGPVVVVAAASVYLLREAVRLPVPLPDCRRQVPEWWRTFFSPAVAALLYGVGLGIGFYTHLSFGTFVAVAAAALASGDAAVGAAVCAPFGLARGLSVLVGRHATGDEAARDVVGVLERLHQTSLPRAVNALALATVAVFAAAELL